MGQSVVLFLFYFVNTFLFLFSFPDVHANLMIRKLGSDGKTVDIHKLSVSGVSAAGLYERPLEEREQVPIPTDIAYDHEIQHDDQLLWMEQQTEQEEEQQQASLSQHEQHEQHNTEQTQSLSASSDTVIDSHIILSPPADPVVLASLDLSIYQTRLDNINKMIDSIQPQFNERYVQNNIRLMSFLKHQMIMQEIYRQAEKILNEIRERQKEEPIPIIAHVPAPTIPNPFVVPNAGIEYPLYIAMHALHEKTAHSLFMITHYNITTVTRYEQAFRVLHEPQYMNVLNISTYPAASLNSSMLQTLDFLYIYALDKYAVCHASLIYIFERLTAEKTKIEYHFKQKHLYDQWLQQANEYEQERLRLGEQGELDAEYVKMKMETQTNSQVNHFVACSYTSLLSARLKIWLSLLLFMCGCFCLFNNRVWDKSW